MKLTLDRIEQKVKAELVDSSYIVILPRSLIYQLLELLKEQKAEIERLKQEKNTHAH